MTKARMGIRTGLPTALGIVALLGVTPIRAQMPPTSFAWFGELVRSTASGLTVKVPVEGHVSRMVSRFKAGDPIVVMWMQFSGEGDAVRYVESAERLPADIGGYVVRGTFVAADAQGKSLTFTTAASPKVLQALGTAATGLPIKFTSSMYPASGRGASPTAVQLNQRPKARPAPAIASTPAGPPPANVAGIWAVETQLLNNAVKLTCTLEQTGAKLSGACAAPPPIGNAALSAGTVSGRAVAFQFDVTGVGVPLVFSLKGEVDAGPSAMTGQVSVSGFDAPFTARKQ